MATYQISIPDACKQDWDQMTPLHNGKHCASCNKVVIDFTGMNEKEILEILLKNQSVCGRIQSKKLHIPIQRFKPVRYTKYHWPSVAAFIVAGMFSVASGFSQTPAHQKLYDKNLATPKYFNEKQNVNGYEAEHVNAAEKLLAQTPAYFILKGKVIFDSPSYWRSRGDSIDPKPPAIDATIQIWKGDRKITEAISDKKGEFQVKLDNKWLNKWLDFTIIHREADEKIEFHRLSAEDIKDVLVIELDRHEMVMGLMITTTTTRSWYSGSGNTYYERDLLMLFPGW